MLFMLFSKALVLLGSPHSLWYPRRRWRGASSRFRPTFRWGSRSYGARSVSDLVKFRKVNVPKPFSRKFQTRNFPRSPTVYGFRRSIFTPGFARDCLRIVVRCNRFYRGSMRIVLTSEQLERFLKAAKEFGPREHAMFLFAVAHGARAQEICNLRISDVNFNNEQIHIARLKGSLPSTQTLLKVKGNSLFDEKAVLKAWLALRQPDADNFVFNSQKSTQMSRVTIFKLFRTIARKAELGETLQHPHVLKHTAAMLLVQQGANAFLIRQALGHKSFDSTLACVNPSDADASAAISKAFNQSC